MVGDERREGGGRRRELYTENEETDREKKSATQSRPARAVPGATFRRCYTRHQFSFPRLPDTQSTFLCRKLYVLRASFVLEHVQLAKAR